MRWWCHCDTTAGPVLGFSVCVCECVCCYKAVLGADGGTVSHLIQEKPPGRPSRWHRSPRQLGSELEKVCKSLVQKGSCSPAVFHGKDEVLDQVWKSDVGPSKPCVAQPLLRQFRENISEKKVSSFLIAKGGTPETNSAEFSETLTDLKRSLNLW